ncbi:MAG: hypothetical protein IJE53_01900 [Bacilli bacterium]|nr:hypothetical protein [Bacilli bacterium]
MTKEERERKAQEYVDKITAPTKENALRSMRLSQDLFLTKNGKFYSMTSDNYIKKLQEYGIYCKEEELDNWFNRVQALVDAIPGMSDAGWLYEAGIFDATVEMMELLSNGGSWDEVRELISKQGHTIMTMSSMAQNLLEFSPYGIQFVDVIVKPRSVYEGMTYLKKAYEEETKRETMKKQELSKRFIKVLNTRITNLNS